MSEHRIELSTFKDGITALAERVMGVDVRAYESMPPDRLASELEPIVSALLADASKLIAEVRRVYESESRDEPRPSSTLASPYVPFEQAIDAAIGAQTASSFQAVGDIAFLAALELRQRAERLEHVRASRSAVAIVGECDSALRRIRKALTSIDVALARAGLVEPTLDFASELDESLRVRRACAKLRARVLAGGAPTEATLYVRLRGAGTAIAMLVGWEVYPSLRVRDRLALRDLQRRILDWLRQDKEPTAGMRLWQDLVGFIRMLAQVNRRQELVDHDTRVVMEMRLRVRALEGAAVPAAMLAELVALEGLDDEADALLASTDRDGVAAWRETLERLALQLRGSSAEEGP
jgi:hypothetical protein